MKVLLVGSGGREHAIAWKLAQSPRLGKLWIAPGNAGTAEVGENLPIAESDHAGLAAFARQNGVGLVVVGPEGPLDAGLADEMRREGIPVFGPSQSAAQIEASKAFAKAFMQRQGIPSARFALFDDFEQACRYVESADYPVVLKASGLAAGKGVLLPESLPEARQGLQALMVERIYGAAGSQVVIEERLSGEEVSLLAFTDGKSVALMPPTQDHKRLLDGDAGPNTGGMGAYAPAPVAGWGHPRSPDAAEAVGRSLLQAAVDGMAAEGRPFTGVLYAGLMLTPDGPRVLEFNCRFGDPETQVILPLLESDLLDVLTECAEGRLEPSGVRWKPGAAACVVLASENYPEKPVIGREVRGLEQAAQQALVFHAGTRMQDGRVVTSGGRVLAVTGTGSDLHAALEQAYRAVDCIHFEGRQYRRDIGARAVNPAGADNTSPRPSAYAAAGVNIDAGNRAVALMRSAVQATYGPQVLAGIGAFGGLYDAGELKDMHAPVLVASTDGVGTKVKLAAQAGQYRSIGADIVNHCINDILVQGARPLFFLDYIASSHLDPDMAAEIVAGAAAACRAAGCALLGGETAEMPGVYAPGEFDVAGTIVGVVERDRLLPRPDLRAGDQLIGLASSGPHTNGYSLIRRVFQGVPLETVFPELGGPLGEALLAPHRSYLEVLHPLIARPDAKIKALAHITGGGLLENLPRVLPQGLGAVLHTGRWPVPPVFGLIQARGGIPRGEMHRVFNMGIGMVVVVPAGEAQAVQAALGEETWLIGELVSGEQADSRPADSRPADSRPGVRLDE